MRINITIEPEQLAMMDKLMKEDLQTNRSVYFVYLIAQEMKARSKGKTGRPKKDDDDSEDVLDDDYKDDLPKNIPYFGEMIGAREAADRKALQDAFAPK